MKRLTLLLMICTEPFPPECISRDPHAILTNPVCIAVSKSCTLHEKIISMPPNLSPQQQADICADAAEEMFARESLNGYRRGRRPECLEQRDKP